MEVTIERILPGGFGLAHADGKTVMVSLAAPGDRVRVRVDREKGNVCFASIVEIIEASSDRIEPPCPYFGRCGGCDLQQMTYQAQLDAKVEIIRDCLHRIAKLDYVPDMPITPAPNQWHYRARAQWQYDAAQKRLGYFESGSRRVCDVAECAVLVPELQLVLEDLRDQMKREGLGDDVKYFRALAGDDGAMSAAGFSRATRRTRANASRSNDSSVDDEMLITVTIAEETYRLDADSFFQTNTELLPRLLEAAIGAEHGDRAIELYSGVGLFTVPLARRFKKVTAVEFDAAGVEFARRNVDSAAVTNVEIEQSDVADWLTRNQQSPEFERPDLLLLDPPRTGAESRVISKILQLAPKRISYVSCDPATLARDLRKIIAGDYVLDSLAAFDMFPQTHHVETIAHLTGP